MVQTPSTTILSGRRCSTSERCLCIFYTKSGVIIEPRTKRGCHRGTACLMWTKVCTNLCLVMTRVSPRSSQHFPHHRHTTAKAAMKNVVYQCFYSNALHPLLSPNLYLVKSFVRTTKTTFANLRVTGSSVKTQTLCQIRYDSDIVLAENAKTILSTTAPGSGNTAV